MDQIQDPSLPKTLKGYNDNMIEIYCDMLECIYFFRASALVYTLHLHLGRGHVLINCLNLMNNLIDVMFCGNEFHKCVPNAFKFFVPNVIVSIVLFCEK